jgi:RecB family exonuclease
VNNSIFFPTSAQLQDFLLQEAGPDSRVVVPHQRLAHQVWHRQRLEALSRGRAAWEPAPLATLHGWFSDLFQSLWGEEALASPLTRLALWRRALQSGPDLPGTAPDLEWAQALDEAHILLERHLLPVLESTPDNPPLVAWRRRTTGIYARLLQEGGWLSPGIMPAYLLEALNSGRLSLPRKVLLVGFQTPAPVEDLFFKALAARTEVLHLQVRGDLAAVRQAVVLPDRHQETEWVAAKLMELALSENLPLHRLAVTSPDMETYAPLLKPVLRELWGPPQAEAGWSYNFSQGPYLADTPVFQAATLPLKFSLAGERREDLVPLLLSPYYGWSQAHGEQLPLWDRLFRERKVQQGWRNLRAAVAQARELASSANEVLPRLEQAWERFQVLEAPGREWVGRLQTAWQDLSFPAGLDAEEEAQWHRLLQLLNELEVWLASETLSGAQFLEWLTLGARGLLLPGLGVQEAGVQIMGLLEMRGLDFSRVLCLGLNAGTFPAPPRPLPLLSPGEKRQVLGGTYQSQHEFGREIFATLLAASGQIILTRPQVADQEEQVATPLYSGEWRDEEIAPLGRPHPAWVRAPAVRAALAPPGDVGGPGEAEPVSLPLPEVVSITRMQTALECPCRFLLEILLGIRELPEIEAGLDPRERGDRLHQVLAKFAQEFQEILAARGQWEQHRAREMLAAAALEVLKDLLPDLHWQAEWERWLGEGESAPLLAAWLRQEKARFEEGWRWQGIEVDFQGLEVAGLPFTLKGRIDRIDSHLNGEDLVLWDYKSGETPKARKIFDDQEEFQLPGYLLAVKKGRVPRLKEPKRLRAGFIGLKSTKEEHLKHEDFPSRAEEWDRVLAQWQERLAALGRRLTAGDFGPDPAPAPRGKKKGACEYCPYALICGFEPEEVSQEEEGES